MVTLGTLLKDARLVIEKSDALVLLCELAQKDKAWLLTHRSETVSDDVYDKYREMVMRRAAGEPVAYIIGKKEFYSLDFEVTRDVLIPRPDTEVLAGWAIENSDCSSKLLDVCTGSGCLGLTVAYYNKCGVTLLDISEAALKIAEKNAENLGVKASFIQCDILSDAVLGKYDIVVSNPPYVETTMLSSLMPDVRCYEPTLALDGGQDGLAFYPVIIKKAYDILNNQGRLGLEVGMGQANAVAEMMKKNNFSDIKIFKDLAGIERVVTGYKI